MCLQSSMTPFETFLPFTLDLVFLQPGVLGFYFAQPLTTVALEAGSCSFQ